MRLKIPFSVFITLLFFLTLGVFAHLHGTDDRAKTEQYVEKMEEGKLCLLEEGDSVTRIWIRNPAESEPIALEKKDGRWRITAPVDTPADPRLSEGMVTALTASVKVRNLRREKDWAEYGLEKPNLEVKIRTERSPEDRSLYFGNQSPTSGLVFARWVNASEDYFLLPSAIQEVFSRSLYTLRSKRIFDGSGSEISKVHIRTARGEYEIARHKDQWFWMEPIPILGETLSGQDLKEFWDALEQLYVKEFLDDFFTDPKTLGIREDGPVILLTEGADGADRNQSLQIGNAFAEKQAYYAKRDNVESPYLVALANVDRVFEKIETLASQAAAKQPALSGSAPLQPETQDVPAMESAPQVSDLLSADPQLTGVPVKPAEELPTQEEEKPEDALQLLRET